MMTDERQGEGLIPALERLPRGSGVIFRHYGLTPPVRRALYEEVRRIALERRLLLILAGPVRLAIAWKADGAHGRFPHRRASRRLIRTNPVHSVGDIRSAHSADLLFVSPIFPTRSHPGSVALGRVRFGLMIRGTSAPIVALGGMTHQRARALSAMGIHGWAAIDALSGVGG
jgi:thiamine-phosphate pyrophosphorylase